jgi:hypothetical protein
MKKAQGAGVAASFSLSDREAKDLVAICNEERCSVETYIAECVKRDIASRREAGWNARDGWDGKRKLEARRDQAVCA